MYLASIIATVAAARWAGVQQEAERSLLVLCRAAAAATVQLITFNATQPQQP